jgi:RimJ/RimL family protein N-acetyltransferase
VVRNPPHDVACRPAQPRHAIGDNPPMTTTPDPWQPIRGARVLLRAFAPADEALYLRLYGDPRVMRHIGPPLAPDAALRAFATVLRRMQAAPAPTHWIVALADGGGDIGLVALQPRRDDPRAADAGVMLLPGGEGRGLGAEAIATLVDWAFAQGLAHAIHTRQAAANAAVTLMMQRQGFEAVACDGDPATRHWRITREHRRRRDGVPA